MSDALAAVGAGERIVLRFRTGDRLVCAVETDAWHDPAERDEAGVNIRGQLIVHAHAVSKPAAESLGLASASVTVRATETAKGEWDGPTATVWSPPTAGDPDGHDEPLDGLSAVEVKDVAEEKSQ